VGSPALEQAPARTYGPMERGAHAGAGLLAGLVTPWGDLQTRGERSPHQSRFVGRACDPVGDPHWSSLFLKDYTLWKGPMLGQFVKSCSPWEGLNVGEVCGELPPVRGTPCWSRGRV